MLHPDAFKGLYLLDMFDDHVWSYLLGCVSRVLLGLGILLVVETDCDCIDTPHHRRKTSSAAFGTRKDQCTFLPQLADRVQRRAFGWLAEVISDVTM